MSQYQDQLKIVQTAFGELYTGKIDGLPGPKTDAAFADLCDKADEEFEVENQDKIVKGEIGNFLVFVDGEDLLIRKVRCTCFGGDEDSGDSGETACGYPTAGHPDLLAVSLPMNYSGSDQATYDALHGSPIPMMPYGLNSDGSKDMEGAWVQITFSDGQQFTVPCVDLGPNINEYPDNAIDATVGLAKMRDPNATANAFEDIVDYRILKGAKYL